MSFASIAIDPVPAVIWATVGAKVAVVLAALLAPALTLFMLPGMWLALAAAGLAEWGTEETLFSPWSLGGCLVLALLGELWEFTASAARAKKAGAGRRGALGALVGGFVGAIAGTMLLPVIGTIAVGGLGALVGSFALERDGGRSVDEALRVGKAAATGQVLGVAGKLAICCAMALWLAAAVVF